MWGTCCVFIQGCWAAAGLAGVYREMQPVRRSGLWLFGPTWLHRGCVCMFVVQQLCERPSRRTRLQGSRLELLVRVGACWVCKRQARLPAECMWVGPAQLFRSLYMPTDPQGVLGQSKVWLLGRPPPSFDHAVCFVCPCSSGLALHWVGTCGSVGS